eukprot:g2486.t1
MSKRPQSANHNDSKIYHSKDSKFHVPMKKSRRPQTAPPKRTSTAEKASQELSMEALMNQGGEGGTGEQLITNLEKSMRQSVESKRFAYDRISDRLRKEIRALEKSKQLLQDLKRDGDALGLSRYPDIKDRLQPVRCISNRPVYARETRIHEMEIELEGVNKKIKEIRIRNKQLEHMRNRVRNEQVEESKDIGVLKAILRTEQRKVTELNRLHLATSDAKAVAEGDYVKTKNEVERKIEMWGREMKARKKFASQKQKFEKHYAKQVTMQHEVNLHAAGDMSIDEENKLRKQHAIRAMLESRTKSKLNKILSSTTVKEDEFSEALKKIGLKLEGLDPSAIVQTLLAHDETNIELRKTKAIEEERSEKIRQEISDAKEVFRQAQYTTTQTTNRMISDREKDLHDTEKKLEETMRQWDTISEVVNPVQTGLSHLARKLLGESVKSFNDPASLRSLFRNLRERIILLSKKVNNVSSSPAKGNKLNEYLAHDAKEALKSTATSQFIAHQRLVSPFNVRVSSKPLIVEEKKTEIEVEPEDDIPLTRANIKHRSKHFKGSSKHSQAEAERKSKRRLST